MTHSPDLGELEATAYRATYADGTIDLFVGLALLWIGSAWIWLPDLAGLAGVFPAVMVTSVLAGRNRLIQEREGYVKWREPRRRWERRNLVLFLAAGVLLLALGVGAYLAIEGGGGDRDVVQWMMPGLLAWLLALLAIGLAAIMGAKRMLIYAAVLVTAGLAAAALEANPGWPLLAGGAAITAYGVVLLVRFLRLHKQQAPG